MTLDDASQAIIDSLAKALAVNAPDIPPSDRELIALEFMTTLGRVAEFMVGLPISAASAAALVYFVGRMNIPAAGSAQPHVILTLVEGMNRIANEIKKPLPEV